jgi:TIR domain
LVLHYVDPWLSKADIQVGERWGVEVAKELESCNFGVICVTKDNVNAPWILFEAGALAKSMQDGRVIPLLLDLDFKDISGPLSQFQAKIVDATSIKELVVSLNKAAPVPILEARLDKLISQLWGTLEKQIGEIPKNGLVGKTKRPQDDILEELVSGVRNLEMRVRDVSEGDFPRTRRKNSKYHPLMMRELIYHGGRDLDLPLQILIMASLVRDDVPWLYELAAEFYRAATEGNARRARAARRQLANALNGVMHGPLSDVLGTDRRMIFEVLHEMRSALEFFDTPAGVPKTDVQEQEPALNSKGEAKISLDGTS